MAERSPGCIRAPAVEPLSSMWLRSARNRAGRFFHSDLAMR